MRLIRGPDPSEQLKSINIHEHCIKKQILSILSISVKTAEINQYSSTLYEETNSKYSCLKNLNYLWAGTGQPDSNGQLSQTMSIIATCQELFY